MACKNCPKRRFEKKREVIMKKLRPSCLECVKKHIAQAIILLKESISGYPEHLWLAIGHLAEAEEESIKNYPQFADKIRKDRLELMNNKGEESNLLLLIKEIMELEKK